MVRDTKLAIAAFGLLLMTALTLALVVKVFADPKWPVQLEVLSSNPADCTVVRDDSVKFFNNTGVAVIVFRPGVGVGSPPLWQLDIPDGEARSIELTLGHINWEYTVQGVGVLYTGWVRSTDGQPNCGTDPVDPYPYKLTVGWVSKDTSPLPTPIPDFTPIITITVPGIAAVLTGEELIKDAIASSPIHTSLEESFLGIAWCESKYELDAIGAEGELGLFQIKSGWFEAADENVAEWENPYVQARVAWYVYTVNGRFGGTQGWKTCAELSGVY